MTLCLPPRRSNASGMKLVWEMRGKSLIMRFEEIGAEPEKVVQLDL